MFKTLKSLRKSRLQRQIFFQTVSVGQSKHFQTTLGKKQEEILNKFRLTLEKPPADVGGMELLISSIWVLNFRNIFIHPWWAQVAAGAISSTSLNPVRGSHPFKRILDAAPSSPSWGHVGRWNQAFHLHRLRFHRHRRKIIRREHFWGLKSIKINVSVLPRMLWMTITQQTCCLQEKPVEPVCTVNTDILWFCTSNLCHHAITTRSFSL